MKIDKRTITPWLISAGTFLLVVLVWVILGNRGIDKIEHYLESDARDNLLLMTSKARVVAQQEIFSGSAIRIKPAVVSICISETGASVGHGGTSLKGLGTGVVVSPTGIIITSSRNIPEASDIKVVNFEKTDLEGAVLEEGHHHIYDAAVVSVYPAAGLAVLKINGIGTSYSTGMPFARLGDSNTIRMGDWCLAMGNPFAQKPMATSGIISSLNQTKNLGGTTYRNLIEITCKGGNDFIGGPIINKWGEVIGLIINKGYAIPSNKVIMILRGLGIPIL